MADAVPSQLDARRFPASQRLRMRLEPRGHAEVVQQAIGIERQEELLVADHRVAERPVEQADLVEREGTREGRDLVGDAIGWPRGGCGDGHGNADGAQQRLAKIGHATLRRTDYTRRLKGSAQPPSAVITGKNSIV